MFLEGEDHCCDNCGATRNLVSQEWTKPTVDLADLDLFECENCKMILDVDDSIRVAKGVLVCPRCAQQDDECKVDSDGCLIDNDGDAETDMETR